MNQIIDLLESALPTLVSVIVGGTITLFTQYIIEARKEKRESRAKTAERLHQEREQQRQKIVELVNHVAGSVASARIKVCNINDYLYFGAKSRGESIEDVYDTLLRQEMQAITLKSQVLDEKLCAATDALYKKMRENLEGFLAHPVEDVDDSFVKDMEKFERVARKALAESSCGVDLKTAHAKNYKITMRRPARFASKKKRR